mgnify:CR=1 FL=1
MENVKRIQQKKVAKLIVGLVLVTSVLACDVIYPDEPDNKRTFDTNTVFQVNRN